MSFNEDKLNQPLLQTIDIEEDNNDTDKNTKHELNTRYKDDMPPQEETAADGDTSLYSYCCNPPSKKPCYMFLLDAVLVVSIWTSVALLCYCIRLYMYDEIEGCGIGDFASQFHKNGLFYLMRYEEDNKRMSITVAITDQEQCDFIRKCYPDIYFHCEDPLYMFSSFLRDDIGVESYNHFNL